MCAGFRQFYIYNCRKSSRRFQINFISIQKLCSTGTAHTLTANEVTSAQDANKNAKGDWRSGKTEKETYRWRWCSWFDQSAVNSFLRGSWQTMLCKFDVIEAWSNILSVGRLVAGGVRSNSHSLRSWCPRHCGNRPFLDFPYLQCHFHLERTHFAQNESPSSHRKHWLHCNWGVWRFAFTLTHSICPNCVAYLPTRCSRAIANKGHICCVLSAGLQIADRQNAVIPVTFITQCVPTASLERNLVGTSTRVT